MIMNKNTCSYKYPLSSNGDYDADVADELVDDDGDESTQRST